MRTKICKEVAAGIITHRQSQITFRRLVRRKKRSFLARLEQELYEVFLSQDSKEAWRLFQDQQAPTPITSTETWGQYATSLYTMPNQPSLPLPPGGRPREHDTCIH